MTTRARAQPTQVQPRRTRGWSLCGLLFRTAGHTVRTQHGVTASVVFDVSIAHDRFGSISHVQQNGLLSHPQDLDVSLRLATQRKINGYRQQDDDNQDTSFLHAILSTSTRMQGEFLRLLFLKAHRETKVHLTATGMTSQRNQSDSFRFKCAAFYQSLKSNVGLAAAKAAALRSPQCRGLWHSSRPSARSFTRSSSSPPLLSHNLPFPRVH